MNIKHVAVSPDLADGLRQGMVMVIHRPLKPQPFKVSEKQLFFGDEDVAEEAWLVDYPCPYGDPGDLLVIYFEGNPYSFQEARCVRREVKRLSEVTGIEAVDAGFSGVQAFLDFWEQSHGGTEFAKGFDPYVWAVRFNRN